jgi:MoaA/NifB/PqqE/SkfB family radical SAM enzyme
MSAPRSRVGAALGRLLGRADGRARMAVAADGPHGDLRVPNEADGRFEVVTAGGRPCLAPDPRSYYLYFVLPPGLRSEAAGGLHVEVEYYGDRHGQFRLQYASRDRAAAFDGLYKEATQLWSGERSAAPGFRRARFELPDFDLSRTQNLGAAFRLEFRRDLRVASVEAARRPPADAAALCTVAPRPDLLKLPARFYPINYLFIEITNACNFKCTWCPDDVMERRRGFMKKQKVFRILDEIAAKRSWLGPLYPVKLHQMGEPMLHPDLVEIVAYAESRGVPVELNTNCGLITDERVTGLYQAGLTNLTLSYQTPDPGSFRTRKAPRLGFDEYRDKVRLAVERRVALGARTHLEIDIMNTKYADGYRIVSEDEQALAFLEDWIGFARELERRHGLPPRGHDLERIRSFRFLDQDENGSRYTLLDGIDLVWKRCHSWGNVIDTAGGSEQQQAMGTAPGPQTAPTDAGATGVPAQAEGAAGFTPDASLGGLGGAAQPPPAQVGAPYCPAPYDQFVIQWNGDVVSCCTDYEGRTKTANVFAESIEGVWRGEALRRRRQDMLEGRLLDVCARCQGAK